MTTRGDRRSSTLSEGAVAYTPPNTLLTSSTNRDASAPSPFFARCARNPHLPGNVHVAQLAQRHVAVNAHAGRHDRHADARRDQRDGPLLRLRHRRDVEAPAPAGRCRGISQWHRSITRSPREIGGAESRAARERVRARQRGDEALRPERDNVSPFSASTLETTRKSHGSRSPTRRSCTAGSRVKTPTGARACGVNVERAHQADGEPRGLRWSTQRQTEGPGVLHELPRARISCSAAAVGVGPRR